MAVNYDPVAAHEYYINYTKKGLTKGRRSTKGFSQTQKEQWAFAKHQLSEEHKAIGKGITSVSSTTRKILSERARDKIKEIRGRLKGLSKEEKARVKEEIQGLIDGIKSKLAADRETWKGKVKDMRDTEKEAYEQRKDKAYETIKGSGKTTSGSKRKKR